MIQLVEDCRKSQTIATERSEVSRAVVRESNYGVWGIFWGDANVPYCDYDGTYVTIYVC